jgi:hypothetical protein
MSQQIAEKDCPDPSVHGNPFRYCPYCTWMEESPDDLVAEGLTKTKLDELIAEVVAARGRWYFIEPYEAGAVALRDAILALTQSPRGET